MSIIEKLESYGHEQIMFCNDSVTGLRAIIAIHNTSLGPGLGGVRFWNYKNEEEAVFDVLRLSRGMSFKAAAAGLHLGGAKAVILGDPNISSVDREALFRRFGKFVENLNGKYITAEDVGVSVKDMLYIQEETDHVSGLPLEEGGSGDPSPVTAYGTYLGMKTAAEYKYGSSNLKNKKIIIKGIGKVGRALAELLAQEEASLILYDIKEEFVKQFAEQLQKEYQIDIAVLSDEEQIWDYEADIFAPCALGGDLNSATIPKLKVDIVTGAANNQLLDEEKDAKALKEKGILYAPDFVINAGGLINVYMELVLEEYDKKIALKRCSVIKENLQKIFSEADELGITTHEAALNLAQRRIDKLGYISRFI